MVYNRMVWQRGKKTLYFNAKILKYVNIGTLIEGKEDGKWERK